MIKCRTGISLQGINSRESIFSGEGSQFISLVKIADSRRIISFKHVSFSSFRKQSALFCFTYCLVKQVNCLIRFSSFRKGPGLKNIINCLLRVKCTGSHKYPKQSYNLFHFKSRQNHFVVCGVTFEFNSVIT